MSARERDIANRARVETLFARLGDASTGFGLGFDGGEGGGIANILKSLQDDSSSPWGQSFKPSHQNAVGTHLPGRFEQSRNPVRQLATKKKKEEKNIREEIDK